MRGYTWAMFNLADLLDLPTLPSGALTVFLVMVKNMNEAGMVYISQKRLQKLSGLKKTAVAKWVQTLKSKQFIDQVDKRAYRINPRYVQVGRRRYKQSVFGLTDVTTGIVKMLLQESLKSLKQ